MKKILLSLILILSAANAQAACNIKSIVDAEDGAVFYSKEHRLYNYVTSTKNFCSENEAEDAGYKPASKYFSNSTARVVECIEDGSDTNKCGNYVMGIYRSLDIYDKVCSATTANRAQVLGAFVASAKTSEKNMDVAKYYGTTNALMDAFPCGNRFIAKN